MIQARKIIPLLTLFAVLMISSGCKDPDFTQFEMEYKTRYTYSSGIGTILPFTTRTPEIQSNTSSAFAASNTRKDKVEQINLQSMKLSIVEPANANFDFLKEISISIGTNYLEEVVIASKSNIQEDGSVSLEMNVDGSVNLKEYVTNDKFRFTTTTKTDQAVKKDITVEIISVFFVDARII